MFYRIVIAVITLVFCSAQIDAAPKNKIAPVSVPYQTGQETTYADWDDGYYETGIAVATRFTDIGDGTVRDNLTGLIWLKDANCFGVRTWEDALMISNSLSTGICGLSDGSQPGNWHLPNLRELHSLVDYGATNPCLTPGHPFLNIDGNESYWTSTTYFAYPWAAWWVDMIHGHAIGAGYKDINQSASYFYIWPVR